MLLWFSVTLIITGICPLFVFGDCDLLEIPNGRASLRMRGRAIQYVCDDDLILFGESYINCVNDIWAEPPPRCVAPGCALIDNITNGEVKSSQNGSVVEITCQPGTIRQGEATLTCDGQKWSAEVPECLEPYQVHSCDFESSAFCGWIQDTYTDDFDWTRHSGETTTGRTGPNSDHTLGPHDTTGHYIYIEASAPRYPGDVARLMSPWFPRDVSARCFQFWYHMNGPNEMNALLVPLFALFIAQSLCETTPSPSTSPSIENKNSAGNETDTPKINNTGDPIETQEPPPSTTLKTSSTNSILKTTLKQNNINSKTTTTTVPKITTTLGPTTSQEFQMRNKNIGQTKSNSNPSTSTTAMACNKTTSLLSESQKFTTLMFFFGLPIGLLLVLVGTLSVALLLVTRKRMKLRKDEEKGEGIEEKKEEENEKAKNEETEKKDEPVQEKEGSDVKESESKDDQIANEGTNKESGQPADDKSSEAAKDELKKSEKEETKDQEQKQSAEQTTPESKQTSEEKGDSAVSQVKEGSKLTATVEVSDSKKSGQEKTEAVLNESKTSDDKGQEKSEKEKTTEEKIIKEGEAGENPENDDFNASLDILSSFMKETENLMHDKTDENEKREDESLKENDVKPSDSTEINDSKKKEDKSSHDDLVNSSQVASKTINTDRNSQGKEDASVQEEKSSKPSSDEQREEDRDKTENETNAIVEPNESQQEALQNEDDPDLPLPPPPEDNLNEDMTNEISGESTEISLPQPPRNSSSSSESEDP